MQKEKHQRTKVYLIIALGIIFCLVGYFRFFYRGSGVPAGAPTDTAALRDTAAAPALPRVTPVSLPAPGISIPEAVRDQAPRDLVRDIFEPAKSAQQNENKSATSADAAPKAPQLTLSGMVYSVNGSVAIVNNQFLRVGDRIGEYKLVRIAPKEVYMRGEDREIVLKVTDRGKN